MPVLSWEQVAAVALHVGWNEEEAVTATSITMPEAGRNSTIVQAGQPYATTGWGLWQITPGNSVPRYGINDALLNPVNNGLAAHWKFTAAGGWSPWTTDVNRLNVPWLPDAAAGVAAVLKLTPAQRKKLLAEAEKGVGAGLSGSVSVSDWSPLVRASARHAGRAAVHLMATARGIRALHLPAVTPVVTVPDPRTLLWAPGQPLPAEEAT